jgi:SAM-dependent methyltransferase
MAEEQLRRLTLEGAERILDVGCGDGKITAALAARVPHGSVLGVDPSREMIAFASNHFGPPHRSNVRFEVADARRLPFRNEFDRIVSFNALHWIPEQEAALCSIRAALKPGGRAFLRLVPRGARQCLEDVVEELRQQPHWSRHFAACRRPHAHFTPTEYRELAERSGFEVVRLDVDDKAWDFQTRENFVDFARATFVEWIQHLPESDWAEFITEALDRYRLAAPTGPQEANTFKFYQMEVELTPAVRQGKS